MATTSSSSSRQPIPPFERPSRVLRSGKDAPRRGKNRQPQEQRELPHHERRASREVPEEENDTEDDNGLTRDEAALVDARFHRAVDIIQSLPKSGPITTTYEEKLMLYSLYKQATEGPVKIPRPSLLDLLGRAKWDAWKKRESLSKPQAQTAYAETLLGILKGFSDRREAVELINELRNFGYETDEFTDEYESITSSQRSMSPPSTSRRTFHSAVPSTAEQNSLQGDVTPKRRPARQVLRDTREHRAYPVTEGEEETMSERSSDNEHEGRPAYARQYESQPSYRPEASSSRPSPYQHPAQYPAPVSAQLPPQLPAFDSRRQQSSGLSAPTISRPETIMRYGTAASAVPSLSAFPPDAPMDVQSTHSRQPSGIVTGIPKSSIPQSQGGPSASLPTLPSQQTAAAIPVITARQANLDRALDSIQTSLTAMHERLSQIEQAQSQSHQLRSSSSSFFSNSPVLQLLKLVFNRLLSFLHLRRPSNMPTHASLGTLLSRALVSILISIRDLSRDAVAVIFLAAAVAALRNARGDWRAVIGSWTRILAMASGINLAREGIMLGGGQ